MEKTITVDEQVLIYAEKMLPIVLQINDFIKLQTALYESFNSYQGEARKEVEKAKAGQIRQLNILIQNYATLAINLDNMVKAFLKVDADLAKYLSTIAITYINEKESYTA